MEITLDRLKNEFDTFINVITVLIDDQSYGKRNKLLYNIDFALLFPYLWGVNPPSVPPFKPYGRRIFEILTEAPKLQPDFQLVFTGPSFWELMDSIYHQVVHFERFEYSAQSHHEIILKKANSTDWKDTLIKSGMAVDELEVLSASGYNERVKLPVRRAIELIQTKSVLKGLGDFIPEKKEIRSLYVGAFNELVERMYQQRNSIDTRPPADSMFHYKVDTANVIASAAINVNRTDTKLLFATEPGFINRYCPNDGRNPLVPVYWISGMLLKRDGYITSEEHFFRTMLERAKEIKSMLNHVSDISSVVGFVRKEIMDFFGKYVIPLRNVKPGGHQIDTAEHDKEIFHEMLTNQKKFESRFSEAQEELIIGAKHLAGLQPHLLEDGLTDVMNAENDDIVRRIRRKLKLR
jgi:hypothetical protein